MAKRIGKSVMLEKEISILSAAAMVGRLEGEGPLSKSFDKVFTDSTMGEKSWERAESRLLEKTVEEAIKKAGLSPQELDAVFSGDLLNQCISSGFAMRELAIPFCGLYSACSTMTLSLICACLALESGAMNVCASATSSHFCSAEKQFRFPVEFASARTPTAQRTVTGAGAMVLSASASATLPRIRALHLGTVVDLGVTDSTNMGAAMAPVDVKIEP